MDTPLEIAFHKVDKSDSLERLIRERADRMHRRFSHINSCRVVFEAEHATAAPPFDFHMRIETRVPGKELVVSRDPGQRDHRNPQMLVRDAFDAMERQLEQFSQEVRGDVKTLNHPLQGRVLRKFSDYGFIAAADGREIYFHRNAVDGDGFDALEKDAPVEISVAPEESPIGPQATNVRPITSMQYDPARKHAG